MMRARRLVAAVGAALIILTNAVALGGAAWNRSGAGEGTLRLSQRELTLPNVPVAGNENSGLSLQLRWRTLAPQDVHDGGYDTYNQGGGHAEWLTPAKLRELGFDVADVAGGRAFNEDSWGHRQLAREVYLVLELDGPAYRESLRRVALAEAAASQPQRPATGPRWPTPAQWGREVGSRLFAVDAGLDRGALRARYPDRSMYAIVQGQVELRAGGRRGDTVGGRIEALPGEQIDVPLRCRAVFEGLSSNYFAMPADMTPFEATVRFGQRLEPWLVDARRAPAAPAASAASGAS